MILAVFQCGLQPVEKRVLRFLQFFARFRNREEPDPVDLWKAPEIPRSWRPFEVEGVAAKRLRFVPITRECPGVDNLSARLPDRAEFNEIAAGLDPGFLFELADRRREQVFPGFDLSFGNAPVAIVLVLKEGSAEM